MGFSVRLVIEFYQHEASNVLAEQFMPICIGFFLVCGIILLLIGITSTRKSSKKMEEFLQSMKINGKMIPEHEGLVPSHRLPHAEHSSRKLNIIRGKMPEPQKDNTVTPQTRINTPIKNSSKEKKPVSKVKRKNTPTSTMTYMEGLQSIIDRYNTEKVKRAFKNWNHTLMITFPDLTKSFLFKIHGAEKIDFSEGFDGEAAVQVKMDSNIFEKMMSKQINPLKAYSSGNLEVKGEMKNMLKLRKLMF